jgi:hypothetical protein
MRVADDIRFMVAAAVEADSMHGRSVRLIENKRRKNDATLPSRIKSLNYSSESLAKYRENGVRECLGVAKTIISGTAFAIGKINRIRTVYSIHATHNG